MLIPLLAHQIVPNSIQQQAMNPLMYHLNQKKAFTGDCHILCLPYRDALIITHSVFVGSQHCLGDIDVDRLTKQPAFFGISPT